LGTSGGAVNGCPTGPQGRYWHADGDGRRPEVWLARSGPARCATSRCLRARRRGGGTARPRASRPGSGNTVVTAVAWTSWPPTRSGPDQPAGRAAVVLLLGTSPDLTRCSAPAPAGQRPGGSANGQVRRRSPCDGYSIRWPTPPTGTPSA
jgi:hypothetical protein